MKSVKVAILDFYKGEENHEIKSISELITAYLPGSAVNVFDARSSFSFPDVTYSAYIVSGGPGDPRDPEGLFADMFGQWLDGIVEYNRNHLIKRPVLLICHSFQMACLHWKLAKVTPRRSPAYGVYPVHLTDNGAHDPLFGQLDNPFYAADFRHFQVIDPKEERFAEIEANILALEKIRPHVPLERAIMAIRFTPDILGVQFHPEVFPFRMRSYLKDPKRRETIIQDNGLEKYQKMVKYLNDTSKMNNLHLQFFETFLKPLADPVLLD